MSGHNNGFDTWVEGEQVKRGFEFVSHDISEGIVFAWSIEGDEYDRGGCWRRDRDVGEANLFKRERGIGVWKFCWRHVGFSSTRGD